MGMLREEFPTNVMGASSSTAGTGPIDTFDPVLISLVRRTLPNLIAYDICGVQPMTGPTGLIFAMRSRYGDGANTSASTEALFNEANTSYSGSNQQGNTANAILQVGNDPVTNTLNSAAYTTGTAM